jgi:hypothetical protein
MSTPTKDDCALNNQADIDAMNGPEFDNFAEVLMAAYVEPTDNEPFQEELGIYRQEQETTSYYKRTVSILSIIKCLQLPEKPKPTLVLENSRLFKRREERLEKERLEKELAEKPKPKPTPVFNLANSQLFKRREERLEKNKTAGIVS